MHVTQEWVQNLSHIIPLHVHNLIPGMITELSAYRVLANQADGFNRADVREYSEALLKWWKVPPFPAPPMLTIMLAMQHTMQPACSPCAAHVRSPPLPVITPGEPGDHLQLGQKAARIVFALTCTSAASERIFSMVKAMFGKERNQALADDLQGSIMLRYNKRVVG